jgi:Xaa-Pro aminopeptidase
VSEPASSRIRFPVPAAELERRWAATRAAMDRAGLELLLAHGHVQGLGGYPRWFCDLPAADGYPVSVVFPRVGAMTVVAHGPRGSDRATDPGDPETYGIGRMLGTASFLSAAPTARDDARALVRALAGHRGAAIGLLGLGQLPYELLTHLRQELPHASFSDAADVVDPIKAVKSPWEREAVGRTVAMQADAFAAAVDAIVPGVIEADVIAAARRVCLEHGSQGGVFLIGSGPPGEPALPRPPRTQGRRLAAGDRITLLIEADGPEGSFAELGRTLVLGPAGDALHAEHELTVAAWRHCAAQLVPGADPAAVFAGYNAFLRAHGRDEEQRIHGHGQGYDLVERPLVRDDETLPIAEGQLIALHPMYVHAGAAHFLCDNLWIGPDGPGEALHGVPQEIVEVPCGL